MEVPACGFYEERKTLTRVSWPVKQSGSHSTDYYIYPVGGDLLAACCETRDFRPVRNSTQSTNEVFPSVLLTSRRTRSRPTAAEPPKKLLCFPEILLNICGAAQQMRRLSSDFLHPVANLNRSTRLLAAPADSAIDSGSAPDLAEFRRAATGAGLFQ